MNLNEITAKVKELSSKSSGKIESKIKFVFNDGCIFIDDTVNPTIINNEIDAIYDIFNRLEQSNSKVVEKKFRGYLQAVLSKYDPHVMGHEQRDELKKFIQNEAKDRDNNFKHIKVR